MADKLKNLGKSNKRAENVTLRYFINTQIFSLCVYGLLFIAACFASMSLDAPKRFDYIITLAVFAVSSALCGFYAGLKTRRKGILTGIIFTLPENLAVLLLSLIFCEFHTGLQLPLSAAVLILSAATGGIFAVNKRLSR